jgi:hypothetical protein
MLCCDCGDIVVPYFLGFVDRWCRCLRHAVWWVDPAVGTIQVHDSRMGNDRAWLIGIHNGFLNYDGSHNADSIRMFHETAHGYLFKTQASVIVRFRPGESSDSTWSPTYPGRLCDGVVKKDL